MSVNCVTKCESADKIWKFGTGLFDLELLLNLFIISTKGLKSIVRYKVISSHMSTNQKEVSDDGEFLTTFLMLINSFGIDLMFLFIFLFLKSSKSSEPTMKLEYFEPMAIQFLSVPSYMNVPNAREFFLAKMY